MSTVDKRKKSIYVPQDILDEMEREAVRQDRSLSWIVQHAWKVARTELVKLPAVSDIFDDSKESSK